MKAYYISLAAVLASGCLAAQAGNVGIDTATPNARLEIHSHGNTSSTKALRLRGPGGAEIFGLPDNGYAGVNKAASTTSVLDVLGNGANDLYIQNPVNSSNNFLHLEYAGGGGWNNANYGGQLFLFDQGGNGVNNVVARGILIAPANAKVPAGVYFGSDGSSGFSLNTLPTTDLDVGGNIRVRETSENIVAGSSCTSTRAGEINYYRGHFYGCNTVWKQLDN